MKKQYKQLIFGGGLVAWALSGPFISGPVIHLIAMMILILALHAFLKASKLKPIFSRGVTILCTCAALGFIFSPRSTLAIRIQSLVDKTIQMISSYDVYYFSSTAVWKGYQMDKRGDQYTRKSMYQRGRYVIAFNHVTKTYIEAWLEPKQDGEPPQILKERDAKTVISEFPPLLFSSNSSHIRREKNPILKAVTDYCYTNRAVRLLIVGYTDTEACNEHNDELGLSRALATRKALLKEGICNSVDMVCISGGEKYLRVNSGNDQAEELNRRVIIYVIEDDSTYREFKEQSRIFGNQTKEKQPYQSASSSQPPPSKPQLN